MDLIVLGIVYQSAGEWGIVIKYATDLVWVQDFEYNGEPEPEPEPGLSFEFVDL